MSDEALDRAIVTIRETLARRRESLKRAWSEIEEHGRNASHWDAAESCAFAQGMYGYVEGLEFALRALGVEL